MFLVHCAKHVANLKQSVSDGEARIERGVRILKYHLDATPKTAQILTVNFQYVVISKKNRAGIWLYQSNNTAGQRSFTASRPARQTQNFSSTKIERH
jgi:hypothetical protein